MLQLPSIPEVLLICSEQVTICVGPAGGKKKLISLNSFICERLTMGQGPYGAGSFHFCVMLYLSQLAPFTICEAVHKPPVWVAVSSSSSFKQAGPDEPLRPFLAAVAWSSVSSEHRSLGHSLHWSTRDSLGYLTADELPPDDWECITTLKSYRKFVVALLKGSVDIRWQSTPKCQAGVVRRQWRSVLMLTPGQWPVWEHGRQHEVVPMQPGIRRSWVLSMLPDHLPTQMPWPRSLWQLTSQF